MYKRGNVPWNKREIDDAELVRRYEASRTAIQEMSKEWGIAISNLYARLDRLGVKRRTGYAATCGTQAGSNGPNWKGGRYIGGGGYVYVWTAACKYRAEHRLVAEQTIGRPLKRGEVVHHKNHDRTDNRPENLEVYASHSEHMRHHMTSPEAKRRGARGLAVRHGRAALLAVLEDEKA